MKNVSKKKISKKVNKKKENIQIGGFTLIELLAVLAILSVVLSIVIYSVLSIVNSSKEKSYLVTINNIETSAGNYLTENIGSSVWIDSDINNSYQYQCVTVQNLIDAGYYSNDVLKSLVDEDTYVQSNDSVYVERDTSNKSITSSVLLVGNASSYRGLCSNFKADGEIVFGVSPTGWSKSKNINIKYKIFNYDSVSNYQYNYSYILNDDSIDKNVSDNFASSLKNLDVSVSENGTLYAKILDKDGNSIVPDASLSINKIDNDAPVLSISSSNNVAMKQDVSISIEDTGSGIKEYYFGMVNPNENEVEWVSLISEDATEGLDKHNTDKTVEQDGTWYLAAIDFVGNKKVIEIDFYKTILSISHASVSPSTILTMEGNEFTIPIPTVENGYEFKGWYTSSDYSGSAITKYAPLENSTLYGKVNPMVYTISYYLGNASSTAGSTMIGTSTCEYKQTDCTLSAWSTFGKDFPYNGASDSDDYGWRFNGWATSSSSTSVSYTDGKSFEYGTVGNINLYAVGRRKLRFYSGLTPSLVGEPYQYWNPHSTGTSYLTKITIPTHTNISSWTFMGYKGGNSGATASIDFDSSKVGTTLTPAYSIWPYIRSKYSRTLTIEYNANGGTGTINDMTRIQYYNSGFNSSNSAISTPSFTLATNGFNRDGYAFSKWADGSVNGTKYRAGATYNAWTPEAGATTVTKTMYAIWDAIPTCILSVTTSGITFGSVSDDTEESWLSTSSDATSGSTSLSLSAGTKYGFVVDEAGNVGTCSVEIANKIYSYDKTVYSCGITSRNCRKSPTKTCNSGYTLNSTQDSCYKKTTSYTRSSSTSKTNCSVSRATGSYAYYCTRAVSSCSDYDDQDTCRSHSSCAWAGTYCTGDSHCVYSGDIKSGTICYQYSGSSMVGHTCLDNYVETCYTYDDVQEGCSSGVLKNGYCYLYSQSSCTSGWTNYSNNYDFSSSVTRGVSSCSASDSFTCSDSTSGNSYTTCNLKSSSCSSGYTAVGSYCYK